MKKETTKLANGEAVREFYSSIKIIEEYYEEKGYRKKAYLYRTLKEKLGWRMSLESFKYHFRKAFSDSKRSENEVRISCEELTPKEEEAEPIIVKADFGPGIKFNPHTEHLPDDRKL